MLGFLSMLEYPQSYQTDPFAEIANLLFLCRVLFSLPGSVLGHYFSFSIHSWINSWNPTFSQDVHSHRQVACISSTDPFLSRNSTWNQTHRLQILNMKRSCYSWHSLQAATETTITSSAIVSTTTVRTMLSCHCCACQKTPADHYHIYFQRKTESLWKISPVQWQTNNRNLSYFKEVYDDVLLLLFIGFLGAIDSSFVAFLPGRIIVVFFLS